MEQVSKFILDKPNLDFVEVDHKKLTDKISEILSKNSKLQMCQIFGEDNGSLVSEIEANLKCFHVIKTEALKNIGECKQLMSDQMKVEESRRKAEEESRKAENESRRKTEEEELERDVIIIAQSIDESLLPALEEAGAGKVQRNQLEDSEISELDRLRRYYTRAIRSGC